METTASMAATCDGRRDVRCNGDHAEERRAATLADDLGANKCDDDSTELHQSECERARYRVLDAKLVASVRRVTRSGRRADYVDAVQVHAMRLARIPLPVHCDVDTAQAFRDASREEIMLNGVCFVGDHRTEAFVAAVKRIVARHVELPETYLAVTDRILRGCSRTLSGADSYFALDELFASPDLLIKPRQSKPIPLSVTLGLDCSDRRFRCRIKSTNVFGLYRHDDIDALLQSAAHVLEPILALDAVVVEHMDLTTDKSHRHLTIAMPSASTAAAAPPSSSSSSPSRLRPSKLALELDELF